MQQIAVLLLSDETPNLCFPALYSEYTRNLYGNQHDYKSDKYEGKITEEINLLRKKNPEREQNPQEYLRNIHNFPSTRFLTAELE